VILINCTGNGWAAAGMIRVLGTIKNSQYSSGFKNEKNDLIDWVLEIQDGMYQYLVRSLSIIHTGCVIDPVITSLCPDDAILAINKLFR
jgi:hypothetical protein